ncbi:YqaJ viral recombinase family protein [Lentzea sp. JNUCC 0626]|uniref:YqaJ viral recombinase family nuclease n=1 Tax=Lentzea sp. JNUCC 0626 TaxID=3367513 RepID=UPI003749FCEA
MIVPRLSTCADLVGRHADGSEQWHALRATGIGGSDIAAILGISPWESAFSLWHRKAGTVEGKPVSPEMSWGHRHEDTIARWYRDTHPGVRVARTGTWRNRQRPWQLANPDRLMARRRVLEIKTDRSAEAWGKPGTDEVPVHYRAQCMWYLDTLGFTTAHLAVLIGLSDAREYVVHWNEPEAVLMRDAAESFWDSLQKGDRPPLDGHDATYRTVRDLNPDLEDVEVEVPYEVAVAYLGGCAAETTAAEQKRAAAAQLMDVMGSARRATCEGRRIAVRVPGPHGGRPFLRPASTKTKFAQGIEAA